ncbi:MAG TPA: PrpR N-terminal domain-containing protein [Candidatus Lachnoclostridium stercoravium]|uniref:PrpR N-terminal domain-containing protein n=1 Tax=Candidatus Lachnoclostridium stercoravium TaxID=2838633 RepID=A0A9D2HGG8_9FIRM|nr:PrpR N-terminal domain-containing protein [Candidatus Lachnoclostridium stercoravium]
MGKIVLLVSKEEMLHQAHNILQESRYKIEKMKVIRTEDTIVEARKAIAEGASIIIARGLQASLIKQYTDIPVVEIVMTAQEMALLVMKAKQILKKPHPVIGVVGSKNMFCDMSYFDVLYDIELRTYYETTGRRFGLAAEKAAEDKVDLIMGGNTAIRVAGEKGIPSLFLSTTEDAMRSAFIMAEHMDFAMEAEKKSAAQIETLLDYSTNGVIRLDRSGKVISVNPMMKQIMDGDGEDMIGKELTEVFHEISKESLDHILEKGEENHTWFIQTGKNKNAVLATLAPVVVDGKAEGAVFTCHRIRKREAPAPEQKGGGKKFIALGSFQDIVQKSGAMQECIRKARLYAMSEKPVLIQGETGTEVRLLAQGIHNASLRSGGPFLTLNCRGMGEEEQRKRIFGENGAIAMAAGGTLFLEEGEWLSADSQYRLYQAAAFRRLVSDAFSQWEHGDIRLIFAVSRPLDKIFREGKIRADLFYLLKGLTLDVPPLRDRKEDLKEMITAGFRSACERYSRYHALTDGAWKCLMDHPWPGNLIQIESFTERMVLTAGKRSLDEDMIRKLFEELYPEAEKKSREDGEHEEEREYGESRYGEGGYGGSEYKEDGYGENGGGAVYGEAAKIRAALKACAGNREKTAQALGISKPTLWRKMKKYGIV